MTQPAGGPHGIGVIVGAPPGVEVALAEGEGVGDTVDRRVVEVGVGEASEVADPPSVGGAGVGEGTVGRVGDGLAGAEVRVGGIGSISSRCSAMAVDRLAPMIRMTARVMASPPATWRQPDTVRGPGCRTTSRKPPG